MVKTKESRACACGKTFIPADRKGRKQHSCSRPCARLRDWSVNRKSERVPLRKCRQCATSFRPAPSNRRQKFCNAECYGDAIRTPGRRPGENSHGYRAVFVTGRGTVYEHRLVMEQMLGRRLTRSENVHHINGDRLDNRPENLELWIKSQPAGQRADDLMPAILGGL